MLDSVPLFVGFDPREEIGFHTFMSSVIHHATVPVCVTPIGGGLFKSLPLARRSDESTDFARIRFLIPWLCGFRGWAVFMDGVDMLMRADINELWSLRDSYKAVQVVQHDYKTLHPRKFVGTPMECENRDYPRKNSSSVQLINCSHFAWRDMLPFKVARATGAYLHQFQFIKDEHLGYLPGEWNWLVDEYGINDQAKLLHWTAGIPVFPAYAKSPMAGEWLEAAHQVLHGVAL